MERSDLSPQKFAKIVPRLCAAAIESDPKWCQENPVLGQCVLVALLGQELFGGEILRVSLDGGIRKSGSAHYVNRISGNVWDFAGSSVEIAKLPYTVQQRWRLMKRYPDTKARYQLLKEKLEEYLKSTSAT